LSVVVVCSDESSSSYNSAEMYTQQLCLISVEYYCRYKHRKLFSYCYILKNIEGHHLGTVSSKHATVAFKAFNST
jgi:hypothetical protein